MKKVLFIIISILSFQSMATVCGDQSYGQSDVLVHTEDYLNDICGDTYCGGDLDYVVRDVSCQGEKCSISFEANSYFANDNVNLSKIEFLSEEEKTFSSETMYLKIDNLVESTFSDEDDDGIEETEFKAFAGKCTFNNPINYCSTSEKDIIEKFYDLMSSDCDALVIKFFRGLSK